MQIIYSHYPLLEGKESMKVSDFAQKYFFDPNEVERFLSESSIEFWPSTYGYGKFRDEDEERLFNEFQNRELIAAAQREQEAMAREQEAMTREQKAMALAAKNQILSSILITSGFNFDGYHITRYSGYISGDDAMEISRDFTILGFRVSGSKVPNKIMSALAQVRRNALLELKEAAYNLGCNAVIGVDFDYLTLEPTSANLVGGQTLMPYIIGVTANGNAVVIEPNMY